MTFFTKKNIILILLCLILATIVYKNLTWRKGLIKTQEKFFKLATKRKFDKMANYFADDYLDQWNFGKNDALLALEDARSLTLTLTFTLENTEVMRWQARAGSKSGEKKYDDYLADFDKKEPVVLQSTVKSRAFGGHFSKDLQRLINSLPPTSFLWLRTSKLPWPFYSWRLCGVANVKFHPPRGYKPGSLRKRSLAP